MGLEFETGLPDTVVENAAVAVVQYVKADGTLGYVVVRRGDVPLSTLVGLFELGKQEILQRAADW